MGYWWLFTVGRGIWNRQYHVCIRQGKDHYYRYQKVNGSQAIVYIARIPDRIHLPVRDGGDHWFVDYLYRYFDCFKCILHAIGVDQEEYHPRYFDFKYHWSGLRIH